MTSNGRPQVGRRVERGTMVCGHARGVDLPLHRAERIAAVQAGVVSRTQLYGAGVTRAQVRAQVRARRWRRVGSQCVSVTTGSLSRAAQLWAAVFEAGPRAFLDGASSLEVAGLERYVTDRIRVSVPRGARVRHAKGLDIRQTRRWQADDVVGDGVPRSRPEVAAVRAALWARSNRQAALALTMTVQQGVARTEGIAVEMLRVRRDKRRRFIHAVLLDLLGGVRSLGELDFARECRRRGLPRPSRQVVRRARNGRYYLDVCWEEHGVVVEVDGIQHSWAEQVVTDAIRHNDVTLENAVVLRLPLLGLRVAPDDFFAQIERALQAGRHTKWSPERPERMTS
jgi:very-short-patch-repair endonuclease